MAAKKEKLEPLGESALKREIEALQDLNEQYKALDKKYDASAAKVLATLKAKDVRRYGQLQCVIVQQLRRTVDWKGEASSMARRLYPTAAELRQYLIRLARRYPRKAIKPSIRLTMLKTEEEL
jgi:CCR4-NOT transcriptional regulation complex NOT5 subunit